MVEISVIIPVYNTEKYLRKCLNSICTQTLINIEIICVNDCSTDDSAAILNEYSLRDERIRIINLEKNQGVSVARNTGIRAANGEYIGFVDSDDSIERDFFEKLYTKSHEGADIVKGANRRLADSRINVAVVEYLDAFANYSGGIGSNFSKKNIISSYFCAAIYNRNFLLENELFFNEGLRYGEDICFSVEASILANRIDVITDTHYLYYYNETSAINSISKNTFSYIHSLINLTDIILGYLNKYDLQEPEYKEIANILLVAIHYAAGNLHLFHKEIQLEDQWIAYILGKCKYKEEIYSHFYNEVTASNKLIKKHQLLLARNLLQQKKSS